MEKKLENTTPRVLELLSKPMHGLKSGQFYVWQVVRKIANSCCRTLKMMKLLLTLLFLESGKEKGKRIGRGSSG